MSRANEKEKRTERELGGEKDVPRRTEKNNTIKR